MSVKLTTLTSHDVDSATYVDISLFNTIHCSPVRENKKSGKVYNLLLEAREMSEGSGFIYLKVLQL